MKRPATRKPTEAEAKAALYGVYQRHGHEGFVISRGPDRPALIAALERGWLFGFNDHVRVTADGVAAIGDYLERKTA